MGVGIGSGISRSSSMSRSVGKMSSSKNMKSNSDYKPVSIVPNPNRFRYEILEAKTFDNGSVVLKIKYIDCTNFEGKKILVYDNTVKFEKMQSKYGIDPHFSEETYSPVARFEPTKRGWELACITAKSL